MKEILLHFECSFHLEQTMQIDILIILERNFFLSNMNVEKLGTPI